jgi:multidrug resistance protein, MATE family
MTTAFFQSATVGHSLAAQPFPILAEARVLVRLAVPIMLIALVNMGMSVTDTLMVSATFGAGALAAVAVGSDFYSILFYLGAGTIGGLAPFYSAAVAKGDVVGRARLERTGQVVVLLLATVLVPVVWTAPDWLGGFGLEQDLLTEGRGYTRAMALTLVPMLGVVLYRTLLTAAERPKVFLKVTAAMLPLNALGNQVFMQGLGPIPAFGPTGAGISSLVVAASSLAVLVMIMHRAVPAAAVAGRAPTIGRNDLKPVLLVGLPIGIAMVTELGIFLAATLYAATLGSADVAAHTLTLRVAGVAYAVPAALLQAAMVRMARAEAAGDPASCRAVTLGSLGLSLGTGTMLFVLLSVFSDPLASSFFDTTPAGLAAAGLAAGLLLLLGAMELVVNLGAAAAGLLRGSKDTRLPMIYTLFGYWAVGAPLGVWLCETRGLGATGIWIGLAAGMTTTTVLMLVRLVSFQRRLNVATDQRPTTSSARAKPALAAVRLEGAVGGAE